MTAYGTRASCNGECGWSKDYRDYGQAKEDASNHLHDASIEDISEEEFRHDY